jgi:predicted RecA/RadA family phage recombinase
VANNFRHTGKRIPVATASAAITSGAMVLQEGFHGVALTSAASGASLWIAIEGVFILPVEAGSVKGAVLGAADAESAGVTLVAAGARKMVKLVGDRDADGKALCLILPQADTAV